MSMDKRKAIITVYLTIWIAISAGVIYGLVHLGYPWWSALIAVYLLFVFVNGSLAYRLRSRIDRLEEREPTPYLQYLFFPSGVPKPAQIIKEEAPKPLQMLVGIVVVLGGTFFAACGVGLAIDADFARAENPIFPILICLLVTGIGLALLYAGWRFIVSKGSSPDDAA
jgi:protein-S-isoprenylcysteine O-methyltransferase Ste14